MRRLLWVLIGCGLLAVPAVVLAGGGGRFNCVVHSIEGRYHVHATRIPFLGLISFFARGATHESVGNLHVANFENFSGDVNGAELDALVEQNLGPGWERVVRESHHGGAQTLIFMHPEGNRMGLFVVDKDRNEMDVVQVSVDPDHLDDDIGHYRHHADSPSEGESD